MDVEMNVEAVRDSLRPDGGLSAADLDRLSWLPPHTELIDGGLFFRGRQTRFHSQTASALESALRAAIPLDLAVVREMSVVLGERQRPEPDIAVLRAEAAGDAERTWYPAAAVRLAVEVVMPESLHRDRHRKPDLYARAGIQHFWLVEPESELLGEPRHPVVHVYELNPATEQYVLTRIHHHRLRLTVPFRIDVDLTSAVDR